VTEKFVFCCTSVDCYIGEYCAKASLGIVISCINYWRNWSVVCTQKSTFTDQSSLCFLTIMLFYMKTI